MCFEGSGFWILGRRFRVLVLVYGIQGSEFRVLGFQGFAVSGESWEAVAAMGPLSGRV